MTPPAGGGFGDSTGLDSTISTIEENGGGNLAVSSQSSAGSEILNQAESSDVEIVAIGGFSGRESEVTAEWLAGRIESGDIRWVQTSDSGGPGGSPADGRTGSTTVMEIVEGACEPVDGEEDLYDCAGKAGSLLNS